MGNLATILVLSAILTGGMLVVGMQRDSHDAGQRLAEHQFKNLARGAATTGLNLTVRKLAADPGPWTNGAEYSYGSTAANEGYFTVDVTPVDADEVTVEATGTSGDTTHVIHARYEREYADGGIPPAFRNVITTDFYIQLQGTVKILAINPSLNASIHTNGDLQTNGNSFYVEGYGTYTGEAYTNQEDNFVPNIDWNEEDPNVFWQDSVHIPPLNLDPLRADAATSGTIIDTGGPAFQIDGDVTPVIDFTNQTTWPWPGTYDYNCTSGSCGTAENPFIMVVEGPLSFLNRVEFVGYGVVVAADHVTIDPLGSGGGVFGGLTESDETKVMLGTLGNIDISGNACMGLGPNSDGNQHCVSNNGDYTHGLTLYANAKIPPDYIGVSFQGTPYLVGGIVAPETQFNGGGTPHVVYASPSETITDPGFEYLIPIGPVLIAYSEW